MKIPNNMLPLPIIPRGFHAWEPLGYGPVSIVSNDHVCGFELGEWGDRGPFRWSGDSHTVFYIRAIKRPAAKPSPAKAKLAKAKLAGKPVKAPTLAKRGLLGGNIPVFMLPADAASVAHMEGQAANAINIETGHHIKTCHAIAKAALASLGIRA